MIVVKEVGRIGNQLFMYAIAEAIRQRRGRNEKIVFYDKEILDDHWKNSLEDYNLPNVEFCHDYSNLSLATKFQMKVIVRLFYKSYGFFRLFFRGLQRLRYESFFQPLLNFFGVVSCINGYTKVSTLFVSHVYMTGYFQSEQYFQDIAPQIKQSFTYRLPMLRKKDYVQQLEVRNSVCISIKVEHNAGSALFDVCDKNYYTQAIEYIKQHVENPLFFICSDNVPYVLEHFIDAKKYDYICQEKELPVSDSLTIMSACKHFIIGNTSFGWWAQYLSSNPNKIVIAPSMWYRDRNHPCDIYQQNWHLIDVSEYVDKTGDRY